MQPTSDEIRTTLHKIVWEGIGQELAAFSTGRSLWRAMSDYSDAINANSYGDLFSVFQKQSVITLTLALAKVFDPSGRSKTRSIAEVLRILKEYKHVIVPTEAFDGAVSLRRRGVSLGKTNAETIANIISYIEGRCAQAEVRDALKAAKALRDKELAHRDHEVRHEDLPPLTWEKLNKLASVVIDFLDIIGPLFIGSQWVIDGEFVVEKWDVPLIATAFRRLMEDAGLGKNGARLSAADAQ